MIEPTWIAGLGAFLFCIGLVGVFTRKNAIIVLMCIEIMLNAVNLNFVAGCDALQQHRWLGIHFSRHRHRSCRSCGRFGDFLGAIQQAWHDFFG